MKTALAFMKPALGIVWPVRVSSSYRPKAREHTLLDLGAFQQHFQAPLEQFIAEKTQSFALSGAAPSLELLCDYPRRMASARGKRVRPYAAYLMYRALGGHDDPKVMRLLVSLELFHLFCLIHDDIIDNGTERHGLPTVQRAVAAHLGKQDFSCDAERIGQAQALLLGDMLFGWAQEAFHANRDFEGAAHNCARRYFSRMVDEVVLGEMLDVDMMARETVTFADIEQKMLLKTASYTFIRPLQIGAALAGRGVEAEKFCHEFGLAVGLAFQIQDDLLDLTGTPQTTRKTLFADLREGQHTYFTQYVFECGTPAQCEQLRDLLGADLTPADRCRVLSVFEASGALARGRADIERHLKRAQMLLEQSPVPARHRGAFEELLMLMQRRPS